MLLTLCKCGLCMSGNELLDELDLASMKEAAANFQADGLTSMDNGDEILAAIEQELAEAIINVMSDDGDDLTR